MTRVLVVSDAAFPLCNSGFSIPCRAVIDGLLEAGINVLHLARGARFDEKNAPEEWKTKNIRILGTPYDDINGYRYLGYVMDTEGSFEKIDAVVYIADPESIRAWRTNVQARVNSISKPVPTVTYGPTEGGPLMKPDSAGLAEIIACGGMVSTYTEFSASVMTAAIKAAIAPGEKCPDFEIGIIPHGVDHAHFRQLPGRKEIRERFKWTDRFVVTNVARNAGRKMWANLFKAIALLKDKYPQLTLYAHTCPFEGYALGGHNLAEIAANLGITDRVIYPDRIPDPWHGVSFEKMIAMYNAADLFVSPSGAEGWNLPVSESAACGLPVACTAYSGMWEQAQDYAIPLHPDAWFTHQSGVELALVDPKQIAAVIESVINGGTGLLRGNVEKGLAISKQRTWQPLKTAVVAMVEEVLW